jgi:hypothetical protein
MNGLALAQELFGVREINERTADTARKMRTVRLIGLTMAADGLVATVSYRTHRSLS